MERAIVLKTGAEHARVKGKVGVANRTWPTQDRERERERERWGPRLRELKIGSTIGRERRLGINGHRRATAAVSPLLSHGNYTSHISRAVQNTTPECECPFSLSSRETGFCSRLLVVGPAPCF